VLGALRKLKAGTAPGRDGFRGMHRLGAMGPPAHGMGSMLVDALLEFVTVVLREEVPLAIRPFFAGASLPFSKTGEWGVAAYCLWGNPKEAGIEGGGVGSDAYPQPLPPAVRGSLVGWMLSSMRSARWS
jgi:hypothetical protein